MRPRNSVNSAGLLILSVEFLQWDEFLSGEKVGKLMNGDDLLRFVLEISLMIWASLLKLNEESG